MLKTKMYALGDDSERLIAVSDLHALIRPLDAIDGILDGLKEKFQVIAAGDYLVNGLQLRETLDWVRRRCGKLAIHGNHDRGGIDSEDANPPIYRHGLEIQDSQWSPDGAKGIHAWLPAKKINAKN